jgi:hypothetical protein
MSAQPTLEERVAALEAMAQPDALTPNVLALNPDGSIGATLSGLLKAQGIILPAGTGSGPPVTSDIQWQRSSDGAVVAQIDAYETGSNDQLDISAGGQSGNTFASAGLGASGQSYFAQLVTQAFDGNRAGTLAKLVLGFGSKPFTTKILYGGDGASNFVQLATAAGVRLSATAWDGGVSTLFTTPDLQTFTNPNAGQFHWVINPPYNGGYAAICSHTEFLLTGGYAAIYNYGLGGVGVQIVNSAGAPANDGGSLVLVGW